MTIVLSCSRNSYTLSSVLSDFDYWVNNYHDIEYNIDLSAYIIMHGANIIFLQGCSYTYYID